MRTGSPLLLYISLRHIPILTHLRDLCQWAEARQGTGPRDGAAVRQVLLALVCLLIFISGHSVHLREPLSEMAQSTV